MFVEGILKGVDQIVRQCFTTSTFKDKKGRKGKKRGA